MPPRSCEAWTAGSSPPDDTGGVRVPDAAPNPGGGRYCLFSANRYGGYQHVALNLEALTLGDQYI